MNIVFSSVGPRSKRYTLNAQTYADEHSNPLIPCSNNSQIYTTNKSDDLITVASTKDITLVLHGYIYGPVPEWPKKGSKSTVDDQSKVAEYLLQRYKKYGNQLSSDIYGHYIIFIQDRAKKQQLSLIHI